MPSPFILALPKAELHLHLEGSVPPETLSALSRRHARPFVARNPAYRANADSAQELSLEQAQALYSYSSFGKFLLHLPGALNIDVENDIVSGIELPINPLTSCSIELAVIFSPLQKFAAFDHFQKRWPIDKKVIYAVLLAASGLTGCVRNRELQVWDFFQ